MAEVAETVVQLEEKVAHPSAQIQHQSTGKTPKVPPFIQQIDNATNLVTDIVNTNQHLEK